MKVLMLGWEFPPYISGGLGRACFGLTKALDELGVEICFVLPQPTPLGASSHVQFRSPLNLGAGAWGEPQRPQKAFHHVQLRRVGAQLQAYATPSSKLNTAVQQLAGQGGKGVPDKPSTMFLTNVDCVACHESPHSGLRQKTGRVTRWRDGSMVLRWCASALLATEKNFRRIMGYKQLCILQANLRVWEKAKTIAPKGKVA